MAVAERPGSGCFDPASYGFLSAPRQKPRKKVWGAGGPREHLQNHDSLALSFLICKMGISLNL